MNIYPHLSSGAVIQFPYRKAMIYRTIVNQAEDGSRTVLQDPNAAAVHWNLTYSGLTDTEANVLRDFFNMSCGQLKTFTFLDPCSNLLAWTEDFSQPVWQKSAYLNIATGITDPLGTQRAARISNTGLGGAGMTQSIAVPGSYSCCFSLYARSASANSITMNRGSQTTTHSVTGDWKRYFLNATSSDGTDTSQFGVTIPAGSQVDVFGLQVETQPVPSTYVSSLDRSGVYPATRFDSDRLAFSSDGPNDSSCQISLYSRLSL